MAYAHIVDTGDGMRHLVLGSSIVALSLAACDQEHPGRISPSRQPRPTAGICGDPKLKVDFMVSHARKAWEIGQHLVWLERGATFDIEVAGGGGGGGGSRAAKESLGGGGGEQAKFTSVVQKQSLGRDYYLIDVGAGGAPGKGGWNWREMALSDGGAGGDTRVLRCSSGALLAVSHGGAGGKGHGSKTADGVSGERFVNIDTGVKLGDGGRGGRGAKHGEDGGDATGYGAGGGGQGATDTPNDGKSHGGRGANGFARLTKIG